MLIRKTTKTDIEDALSIYAIARSYMSSSGNPNQWAGGYPGRADIERDIAEGTSYVLEDDGEVVGIFYFNIGVDKTYVNIYEGEWLNDLPYAVIHRIAVKYQGRGLVQYCFNECYKKYPNLKIDTHRDNIPMQRALLKNGFIYCGIIYLESGDERLAYQRSLIK